MSVFVIVFGASTAFGQMEEQQRASLEKTVSAAADPSLADRVEGVDWAARSFRIGGATRGRLLPVLYVSLAGLQAFDAYSTSRGLARGATEANPTMRPFVGNAAATLAIKGGATAVTIVLAERLWRNNRRGRAVAVVILANSVLASVAAHNAALLRAQR
jgi:hypothetical protein